MKEFGQGLFSVFEAFKLIRKNKDLWLWVLFPFIIYTALLFFSFSFGVGSIEMATAKSMLWIEAIGLGFLVEFLYYPLLLILSLAFAVLLIYLIFVFGSILASPFNAVLAEKTLLKLGLIEERPLNIARWLKVTVKMFFTSILKTFLFLFIGIFIFIASFIPGLNLVSIYLALMVMSFDSMDYSFELLELPLARRVLLFRSSWLMASGLSTIFGLTLIIPGLILLFLPVSVVGSCVLLKQQIDKNPKLIPGKSPQ